MNHLPAHLIGRLVREALLEDVGPGDLTCEALLGADAACRGRVIAGERLVAAGLAVAEACFRSIDGAVRCETIAAEGAWTREGGTLMEVSGPARSILTAERTALNFLGRISGIATLTRRCVEAVEGTGAIVCDTRKTTPTLRALERHAVRVGGGTNHRFGLFDAVMVKDNHFAMVGDAAGAVMAARARYGTRFSITIEVDDLGALDRALDSRPDVILLDNMTTEALREAVRRRDARFRDVSDRVLLEASGGIALADVSEVARSGVDRISIGALTRSAPAIDVGLECEAV